MHGSLFSARRGARGPQLQSRAYTANRWSPLVRHINNNNIIIFGTQPAVCVCTPDTKLFFIVVITGTTAFTRVVQRSFRRYDDELVRRGVSVCAAGVFFFFSGIYSTLLVRFIVFVRAHCVSSPPVLSRRRDRVLCTGRRSPRTPRQLVRAAIVVYAKKPLDRAVEVFYRTPNTADTFSINSCGAGPGLFCELDPRLASCRRRLGILERSVPDDRRQNRGPWAKRRWVE